MTSNIVTESNHETSSSQTLAFDYIDNGRDLRLDFLRGMIMILVIVNHIEYFSLLSMFAWERIGLISSAEGFVSLSGIVLGIVYKKKLNKLGFRETTILLWKRAFQLYRANVWVILSILLLGSIPLVNVYLATHWVDPLSTKAWPLFPKPGTGWKDVITQTLLLRIGPHQFQIIGFYTIVLGLAPIALFLFYRRLTVCVILISWIIYAFNAIYYLQITGAQFERGFPLLTWQVLFFNGMAVGYHHQRVFNYLSGQKNKQLIYAAVIISVLCVILTLSNPKPVFWPWQLFSFFDNMGYAKLHSQWFDKTTLGIGRILNNLALFIVMMSLLSNHWRFWNKVLGWLVIPIGQASLYVFVLQVYIIIIISNTPLPNYNSFVINSLVHIASVLTIWYMIKKKFLFNLIPR
ncbi:MAG: OpgC domain-containing protein [Methylococcales bacterium]